MKLAAAAPPVDDLEARQWLANVRRRLTGAAPGPERLGRYVLRRRLGAGGMGIVYEAHDPELQRPVAIKVIAADRAGDEARLQQEARALAELDHDNVVEVYDVGTSDGSVYVVMELVVGVTLEAWVADDDPSIEECMEVLLAAGRGLAAAHRAGIVHRDVKPGNVMVRHDGRVCVLDFGLARRGTGHPAPATRDAGSAASVESSSGTTTTRGRGFAGTRAYAAPEQVRGDPVDARADQFSFCVTAAELLARRRAGEAGTDASWDGADANVRLETLIRLTPRRYRDAIGRGLSLDARDRYPSMDALLRALQSTGSRGRGRLLAAGALGAVVVPLFGGLADDAVMPCAEIVEGLAEELFEGDSNETQRQRWLTHWSEARRRACEEVRADPSRQFAVSCLDQQRKLYDAALQTAAAVSDPDKRLAVWEALPEPGDCDKAVASRPQARIVREQVAQSRLHHAAGELETATRLAVSSVRDARGLDEPLVLADALAAWGTIELERELFEEATRAFAESFDHAQRHRDDHLAAASALGMVKALVLMQDHGDDAQRWLRYASAAQARCGDRKLEVEVLRAAAMHARAKGELDAALQHLQAAHAQLRQADGAARAMSTVSHNLGTLHVLRGEYDRAIELIETARSQTESILGSEHPRLAEIEADLGAAHLYRGDIDAAQLWLDRATERWDRRPSEKPQRAAMTLSNVATVRWRKGDLDGAIEAYRSAVDLFVNALGPEHPHVAQARDNLGVALFSAGRLDEALTEFLAAQILTEERLGPEHPNVAKILIHVAQVHEARGDFEEAFTRARRAADLGAATLGERHGEVGHALATLARIDIARGRQDDALVAARRALSIYEEVGVGALERAAVRATLAYARSHAQPRPNCRAPSAACDEALAQAHQALADYEAAGPAGDSGADALRTWAKPHFGQRWRG